ncbi:MAG: diguanylate cyclase [Kofleriaceae bacterium]|nr:diguanylate cyclase [Kofleriaceae bacterium]
MSSRLAVFDPSGRLLAELAPVAEAADLELVGFVNATTKLDASFAAVLVAPLVAPELAPLEPEGPPRWIVGDSGNAARLAGAAAQASAAGVLLAPISVEALLAITRPETATPEVDLARARGLIATSLVDLTGSATDTLLAVSDGFAANDCIVWWRDGTQMTPTAARLPPSEQYRPQVATAARIAAAAAGTVILAGPKPRAVIADALRSSPSEVAGLVAIVTDEGRRFSAAERTDLKAIATRLTRELSWLSSHRRIVAEGERLLATSLHDPLTGAMTRGAFEQAVAHEIAAASRRDEKLTLAVFDVVGTRKINLMHSHKAGDEVLAQVSARVRASVRGNDPLGRLGGDELAVLLVGASSDQATQVCKKILSRLQDDAIKIDDTNEITIKVRVVLTEIGARERSGEAALARCYGALRLTGPGEARVIPPDQRVTDLDAVSDTGSLSAGTIVGGTYRVVHELSRGAMGVVYRGEDLGLGRAVAIKVLRSDLASDRDLVARFRAEAGILASLQHPNLVQVYALGEHAQNVYFVMELVEGQPLSEVVRATLERSEWFPTAAVAQITLEIGDALDAMHALGVIHRDVKPANILLDRERDRAVLVDVGVAVKAGDVRDAAGTPGFAAPESFLEQTDGPTTDVYGLAATVYCMLTGRPPFGSGPAPQVVQRQITDALTPPSQLRPSLSEAVDAVLSKALTPNPKKRWASASTFAIALGRALERLPEDQVPQPTRHGEGDPAKRAQALFEPTASIGAMPDLPSLPGAHRVITGQVRAAHLRVLSKLLQHHLGESGVAKLANESPLLATVLAPTLAPLAWVDLADLITALDRTRERLPSQLVPRKIGRGTMSATFAHLFGADPSSLSPLKVLAALPSFWDRYHNWGSIEAQVATGVATITLHGYPGSTDVCAVVGAELERIVELTSVGSGTATHAQCSMLGGQRCVFQLTWP